jgi:ribosomal protein S27AE
MKECPRCWRYTDTVNFDNLCNRCVDVILAEHPDHPSVKLILQNLTERGLTPEDNPERDPWKQTRALEIKDH